MGQTLTHGVYLPDEGERNCYSGLAANWQLLDGAVGTVAAHTTALSGKAPLVHTHTKADITDFPAYGNTAGTICEGNDSRLSDARTPVAHTHGKADITDLFNSANTWTANQNFKNTAITDYKANPSADTEIWACQFWSNDNKYWGGLGHKYLTTGFSEVQLCMSNWTTSGSQGYWHLDFGATKDFSNVYFQPSSNNNVNLGSSSKQWLNTYSKGYYYNGVAWGLDKANVWTGNNSYTGTVSLEYSSDVAEQFKQKLPKDVSTSNDAMARVNSLVDSAGHYVVIETIGHWANYVAKNIKLKYKNDSTKQGAIEFRLYSDGSGIFYPQSPFGCDLGNIYNKWKTLNGVNPGALSFPSGGTTENTDWFNVAGDILPTGGNATDFTGGQNFFTPAKDGWLALAVIGCESLSVWSSLTYGLSVVAPNTSDNRQLIVPVVAGKRVEIKVKGTRWHSARLIITQGNV